MDPLKTLLVIFVSFMFGIIVGGWLLFVFVERTDRPAGDVYLEGDQDDVSQSNDGLSSNPKPIAGEGRE